MYYPSKFGHQLTKKQTVRVEMPLGGRSILALLLLYVLVLLTDTALWPSIRIECLSDEGGLCVSVWAVIYHYIYISFINDQSGEQEGLPKMKATKGEWPRMRIDPVSLRSLWRGGLTGGIKKTTAPEQKPKTHWIGHICDNHWWRDAPGKFRFFSRCVLHPCSCVIIKSRSRRIVTLPITAASDVSR